MFQNAPADDFNWREYDMTEWNKLEEKYLTEEEIEILTVRRKEIETRQKQDYIDRVCVSLCSRPIWQIFD